jgi:hypothetical protein
MKHSVIVWERIIFHTEASYLVTGIWNSKTDMKRFISLSPYSTFFSFFFFFFSFLQRALIHVSNSVEELINIIIARNSSWYCHPLADLQWHRSYIVQNVVKNNEVDSTARREIAYSIERRKRAETIGTFIVLYVGNDCARIL